MGALELLDRYGSPLYHYRLELAERAAADLVDALPQPSRLYYSLKANPHPDLVRALSRAGCGAEISSAGELRIALRAGVAPSQMLYTGPAKTTAELAAAVGAGLRLFSAESPADLRRVADAARGHGVTVDCLLRVKGAGDGAAGIRMTGAATQFGFGMEVLRAELAARPAWPPPGVRVTGVHLFSLSNARDEAALLAEFQSSVRLAAELRDEHDLPMAFVDLGGGFAAPYATPGARPRYTGLRAELSGQLDEYLPGWRQGEPIVAFESGRYLVGDCGSLVCTTMEVKRAREVEFVLLDSGINHLGGMAGLGRLLRPAAAPADARPDDPRSTLVGPLCTPADVLGRDVPTSRPFPGKPLVFPNVGAYGLTAGLLGFLSRPAPVEVTTHDGEVVSATRVELVRGAV